MKNRHVSWVWGGGAHKLCRAVRPECCFAGVLEHGGKLQRHSGSGRCHVQEPRLRLLVIKDKSAGQSAENINRKNIM